MQPTVLTLPGNDALAARLTLELGARRGRLDVRRFPDGESYVRVGGAIAGRQVVIAATLDRPDEKLLPLMLAAATAREIGATSVGLVAPYLPYLRQDRRFRSGEAVSARHFAGFVSQSVDWLVTVDPHLHRLHALGEVYPIPTESITAAPRLAQWVRTYPEAVSDRARRGEPSVGGARRLRCRRSVGGVSETTARRRDGD